MYILSKIAGIAFEFFESEQTLFQFSALPAGAMRISTCSSRELAAISVLVYHFRVLKLDSFKISNGEKSTALRSER